MKYIALGVVGYIAIILGSILYHTNTFASTRCISYDNGAWITCTNDEGKQETIYINEN